jgi:VWFA-related protein
MNSFTKLSLVIVLTICGALIAFSQTQSKLAPQEEKIVVERSEVVLDAVVRDKKGRPVTNLSANDFEVYEDGALQQIASFRLITRGALKPDGQRPSPQTAKAVTAIPLPSVENRPGAVALVFDRLSGDARAQAHAAALAYLDQGLGPNDYVGVFRIDQSLNTVQTFTNDPQLIRKAIDQISREGGTIYNSGEKEISRLWETHDQLQRQIEATNNPAEAGFLSADLMFINMKLQIAEDFEWIERDQQGYSTPNSLLTLINGMGTLAGRKAMVFFSEGVAIPNSAGSRFRSVISNANRANVSIYTVDAAGLRAESSDAATGKAIARIGDTRLRQATSAEDPSGFGTRPMMRDLERNEDLVRKNPEGTLRRLASETGGASISSTNDPGSRLRQVNEDLHSYYLLSYSPRNPDYDGRFRQIDLRVIRAGMAVQARKGYYALRESYDSPVIEYEVPALAILSGKTVPGAFQTHCAAFSFPERTRPGLVPVVVEVPAGAINFLVDSAKTKYSADFSIVVLIRDAAGNVARKLSTHYLLNGPYDKLEAALNGSILFYKETQLGPGRYLVSSIVYDALAKQSSTSAATVTVPTAEKNSLQLSSIVLVKTGEHLSSANNKASRLFRFNELLLYPNLGEPLSKSDDKELTLFLTAYAPIDASATKLSLEIAQDGRTVGQLSYDLPPADQTGRIQYASAIPLEKFQPGNYELKVTVQNVKSRAVNSAPFTISP